METCCPTKRRRKKNAHGKRKLVEHPIRHRSWHVFDRHASYNKKKYRAQAAQNANLEMWGNDTEGCPIWAHSPLSKDDTGS